MNTENTLQSKIKSLLESAYLKHQSGELDEAESLYKQILEIRSESVGEQEDLEKEYYPIVLNKLGVLSEAKGKSDVAAEFYQQALRLKPDYAGVYYNLGNVFLHQGKLDTAIEYYQQALKIEPNDVEAHYNLGCAFKLQRNFEAAVKSYQQALKLRPDFLDLYCNLGNTFYCQGNLEAAIKTYQQALELQPDLTPAEFGIFISQLPIIYSSCAEINLKRNNYQQHLQLLAQKYKNKIINSQSLENAAIAVGSLQPFYLAYQGYNNRDLQRTYGEMIVQIMSNRYPQWSQNIAMFDLKSNEKIRVGFVSKFFYNHSNWKIPIKGWVENLDRSQFELFAYHTDFIRDKDTATAAKEFDKFTQGSLSVEQWCELIQKDKLHVLIFPEFGMDPMTLRLGCLRLAPIQITSWGHPDTSGLPTIDYYLSSDLMEPENAQEHYTEQLVRLPNLSIYYTPLVIEPLPMSKKDIGIDVKEIMFWCCQSLFKYLPQHDDVFPRIAQKLPNAKFAFIKRESTYVTEEFRQRLGRSFEGFGLDYQDYCIFLNPLNSQEFAGVAANADVFLDSIGWSGCNSTLESIAHNTPVVTLPQELMRSRHSMAILKMMGIEETIATTKEDYIELAVRLGQDIEYRQYISGLIAQNKHKLYNDLKPVRALEEFLLQAVGTKKSTAPAIADTLRLAIQEQRDNHLDKAKLAYQQVLEMQPNHPEALYGLGMLAQQTGELQQAEQFLSTAAQVQPDSVKVWFALGNLHQVQGQLPQAEEAYKQAITLRPDAVSIYNNLGYTLQQQGKLDEAVTFYQKALDLQPNCTEAKANLGNVLNAQGKLSSDQKAYYAALNNELGVNRKNAGDLVNAVAYYQQAIIIKPDLVEAHKNLAEALHQQGRLDDALESYQQAIKIKPDHTAYHNSGYILDQKGKLEQAIEAYQQALKFEVNAITYNNLGNLFKAIHKFDAAIESYQQAIKINPNLDYTYYNLGTAFQEQNRLDAAVEAFEQVLKLSPNDAFAKFGICMSQLPIIYKSVDEIELRRNQYQQHLFALQESYNKANSQERADAVGAIGSSQPFYLAYQGLNDRSLQQTYGEMICQLMATRYPQWCQLETAPQLAENEKIRIGFVSKYFYNHSVWKIPMKGWVENLDRSEFELFGYHTGNICDQETTKAAKAFDKFTQGPLPLEQWAQIIQQDKLHILIFPEFGMDSATVQIGCLKLASIQVAFGGHPETSGLPTIDYHLSSDLMEPENAQEHYTEQLVRLPNLAIHYTPLGIEAQPTSKQEIGIASDEIMFWSCQSLFKYLPQHDDVFPRIAQKLPNAKFVFIQHHSNYVTEIFRQRLKQAFDEFDLNSQDYCIFLPRLDAREFASTAAIADVFLDNIGWSGNNTAMESSAFDVPIVTYPGEMMRSRHSMAILKMMGIEETIAATKEEYIEIAVRLGQDKEYRQYISGLIAQNKHKLYNDLKPVRALEDFLLQTVGKTRKSAAPAIADTLRLAIQEQRDNHLDKAKLAYEQVLEIQPNHPEALYGLGTLAQQAGEVQQAEQFLIAAAQVQPDSVKVWFSLGNLYFQKGQLSQAEEAYKQAITLRPDAVSIYNNLGYTLQQQGKLDEAITAYQKALELQPSCTEAKVNLGNILNTQGKLSSEQKAYYAALNNQLGVNRKNAGDLVNAIAYYHQAISIKPDLLEAHYNLGIARQAQGELKEAIACYQRTLEINPDYKLAYFNLAQLYQHQNNLEAAISAYRQGIKLTNPCYAKVESKQGSEIAQELPVTPAIPQTQVQIGNHRFPGIATVQGEQGRPFWSVVIPVYATEHRRQFLLECLTSVLMQWRGHEEMEILLIDDASVPPLYDLVNAIGGGVIRYYRNPQNMGAYQNFNIGVALSRGQWIHLLHDDDYVLPGFYDRLKQSLEGCPESIGAAFTGYENIDETGKVVFTQQVYGKYRGVALDFLQKIGILNLLNMPAVVISRKVHEHLGGYQTDLNYTGDWELYKRIAAFYDWWCEPEILARYRQHSHNITTESIFSGSKGTCLRRAIEISEDYIPQEISALSRSHNFNYCLSEAAIPLHFGNVDGGLRMVKEALKIDSSTEAVTKLFAWLKQDEAAPLRSEIASRLVSSHYELFS